MATSSRSVRSKAKTRVAFRSGSSVSEASGASSGGNVEAPKLGSGNAAFGKSFRRVHVDGNVTTVHSAIRITASSGEEEEEGELSLPHPSSARLATASSSSLQSVEAADSKRLPGYDAVPSIGTGGGRERLPILIIPGFMSSGLEVKDSAVSPSWVGKRVWINLTQLGFHSIHLGGALVQNGRSGHSDFLQSSNLYERNQRYLIRGGIRSDRGEEISRDGQKELQEDDEEILQDLADMEEEEDDEDEGGEHDSALSNADIELSHVDTSGRKTLSSPFELMEEGMKPPRGDKSTADTEAAEDEDSTPPNKPQSRQELRQEYMRQKRCKSDWLQHMSLGNDMVSERPGTVVRPIPGLAGVDYLTPGALTSLLSYVFGPVIRALEHAGWTAGHNLDAAPYDWRVPPARLEERDGYFTQTMQRIDVMYRENGFRPVVLIGHSLGCKTAHYLLNFLQDKQGREWIDKRIHAFVPIGGPHGGAPKSIRGCVDGDKLGLEAFLSDEEGLVLGRSLGSVPWLVPVPTSLPSIPPALSTPTNDTSVIPPPAFLRREGSIRITVLTPMRCEPLFRDRQDASAPTKLCLSISYGKHTLRTILHPLHRQNKVLNLVGSMFTFPAPPTLGSTTLRQNHPNEEDALTVSLFEPGFRVAEAVPMWRPWKRKATVSQKEGKTREVEWRSEVDDAENKGLLACLAKRFCCCICCGVAVLQAILKSIYDHFLHPFAEQAAKAAGKKFRCASSNTMYLSEALFLAVGGPTTRGALDVPVHNVDASMRSAETLDCEETAEITVQLFNTEDKASVPGSSRRRFSILRPKEDAHETSTDVRLRVEYTPPLTEDVLLSSSEITPLDRSAAASPFQDEDETNGDVELSHKSKPHVRYDAVDGELLLRAEGLERQINLLNSVYYKDDPLGPRSRSAVDRPPVKRVRAIYGINLPTEIGAVYRRRPILHDKQKIQKLYCLDMAATVSSQDHDHEVSRGIVRETAQTPQTMYTSTAGDAGAPATDGTGAMRDVKRCSGDGTVPYWSLQQPRRWQCEECDVSIDELEGAEHREILADARLHHLLIHYCTVPTSPRL